MFALWTSRHHKCFQPLQHGGQLVLLNRPGRIDVLGANSGTFTDKCTAPYSVGMCEHGNALPGAFVARIHVIALGKGQRGRANKYGIESDDGTSRITQGAVDAHAELLVSIDLRRGLQKLSL